MTGTYDYNKLLSTFYISYILFEMPSNLACKWIGPGWFIPFLSLCFGIASVGTAFVNTLPQACGVRFVLGVFESGMMPGISYYLSRWYVTDNKPIGSQRLSCMHAGIADQSLHLGCPFSLLCHPWLVPLAVFSHLEFSASKASAHSTSGG